MTAQTTTKEPIKILISTDMGDMTAILYDETPHHRDNFVKLVNDGFYNGSIFHRVINKFMIQGGGAPEGKSEIEYTVPAEFNPTFFHKKGALAAARTGDYVNPQKASSGSQFYIVQGDIVNEADFPRFEAYSGKQMSKEQREAYSTVGGTPHLDGQYTVFGQVIEGLDVIDKIASVKTKPGDRPVEDIKMTITIIK